jgi:hypothetical protein
MRSIFIVAAASVLLSGCYSFRGPAPVYDSYGIVPADNFGGTRIGPNFQRFVAATELASGCEIRMIPGLKNGRAPRPDVVCPRGPGAESRLFPARDEAQVERMGNFMRAGYALVRADCINYFAVMGRNQARSRILRGSIGPLANLITGVLSLRGVDVGEESDAITAVALGTATFTSGLDIFDQNFLFGSDNISIVQELVVDALAVHANSTLTGDVGRRPATFEEASSNLIHHQSLCRPAGILRLVRSSIQNANVTPEQVGAAKPPKPPEPQQDEPAGEGEALPTTRVDPERN